MITEYRKKYLVKYNRKRRFERRNELIKYLGGKCANCGTTEDLEFDHINPKTIEFRIGSKLLFKWARLLKEAKKCQLLCKPCHRNKTNIDNNFQPPLHGTVNMYNNHRCRCVKCKNAWSKYARPRVDQWRKAQKNASII